MVKKASSYRGAYRVPLFNLSVGLCVNVCVIFVIFTDCESYTRVISTNQGCMEAGEFKLTRETCFRACRLVLDAVAGLLWISWCCFGLDGFFRVFFFFLVLFVFELTRPAASIRLPLYLLTSTSY